MTDAVLRRLQLLALLVLFVSLVSTVWRIGVMHTDDASWVLAAHRSPFAAAWEWATSQGRLYGVVVGSFMLHALRWEGTPYGELLKFGTFGGFVIMLGAVLRAYWGWRVALLSVGLFLGLHALRFEGSALLTYPLLVWPSGIGVAVAILCGRQYSVKGHRGWLALSGASLFFSLFTNEALTATFVALFTFFWLANWWLRLDPTPRHGRWQLSGRDGSLAFVMVAVFVLYAASAAGFLLIYPSHYEGHSIAPFDLKRIARVLLSFSTSGSVLHDLISPYTVTYSDSITASGKKIAYIATDSFKGMANSLPEVLLGLALGFICWTSLAQKKHWTDISQPRLLPEWTAVIAGLVLTVTPVLPVALTERYQNWHIDLGVGAYVTSIVSHFGLSIVLAGVLAGISSLVNRSNAGRLAFGTAASCLVGLIGFVGIRANERIAWDMKLEGARWEVFRRAIPLLDAAGMEGTRLIVPQFGGGSWFSVVPERYWTEYASEILGRETLVSYNDLTPADVAGGAILLMYVMSGDRLSFDLVAARLALKADGRPSINRIAIELGLPTTSEIANAVLSYYDPQSGQRQVHVNTLPKLHASRNRFLLQPGDVEPGSIQLSRQAVPLGLPLICAPITQSGTAIFFGTAPPKGGGLTCSGKAMLGPGWGAPETTGVWTSSNTAVLSIPSSVLSKTVSSVVLDMNTYTGLGFTSGRQVVRVSISGGPEQTLSFTSGEPAPEVILPLPSLHEGSRIDIKFQIEKPIQPSSVGRGPDKRNLGVFLRSVKLQ